MDAPVQRRLVDHLNAGGRLLLLGRLPRRDLAGATCTLLADALGLRSLGVDRDRDHRFPTVKARAWAAPWPATRVGWLERLEVERGTVLLTDHDAIPCGAEVDVGAGRAVVLSAELPSSLELFGRVLTRLGARPRLSLRSPVPGVFAMTSSDDRDQRLLHLLNITGYAPVVQVGWDGGHPHQLRVPARTPVTLPMGLITPHGVIDWADAELTSVTSRTLQFGPGLAGEESVVRGRGTAPEPTGGRVSAGADGWVVRGSGPFVLRFG